jgi:hypothetical protein
MSVMMSTMGTPRILRQATAPAGRIRGMFAAVQCIVAVAAQMGPAARDRCGSQPETMGCRALQAVSIVA